MIDENARQVGDRIATTGGVGGAGLWSLAEISHIANDLVPILTAIMILLSIGWYGIRYWDRFRLGPVQTREKSDGE